MQETRLKIHDSFESDDVTTLQFVQVVVAFITMSGYCSMEKVSCLKVFVHGDMTEIKDTKNLPLDK